MAKVDAGPGDGKVSTGGSPTQSNVKSMMGSAGLKRKAPQGSPRSEGKGDRRQQRKRQRPTPAGVKGVKRPPVSVSKANGAVESMIQTLADQCAKELEKCESEVEEVSLSFTPGFHASWDAFIKLIGPIPQSSLQPYGMWGDSLLRHIKDSDTHCDSKVNIGYDKSATLDPTFNDAQFWIVTRPFHLTRQDQTTELVVYWDHDFMPLRDGALEPWEQLCYSSEWVLFTRRNMTEAGHALPPIFPRWIEVVLENNALDLMTAVHSRVLRNGSSGLYRDDLALPGFSFSLSLNRFYPLVQDIVKRNAGKIWTVISPNYALACGTLRHSVTLSDNAAADFLAAVQLGRRAIGDFFRLFPARTFTFINAVAGAASDIGGAAHDAVKGAILASEDAKPMELEVGEPLEEQSVPAVEEHAEDMATKIEEANKGPAVVDDAGQIRTFVGSMINSLVATFSTLPMPAITPPVAEPNALVRECYNAPGGPNVMEGDLFEWTTTDEIKDPTGAIVTHEEFLSCYELSVADLANGCSDPLYPIDLACVPKYSRGELEEFVPKRVRKSLYAWASVPYYFASSCEIAKVCVVINRCCLQVPPRTATIKTHIRQNWRALDERNIFHPVKTALTIKGYPDDQSVREAMVANMPPRSQKVRLQPFDQSEVSSKFEFNVKLDETLATPKGRGLVNVGNKSFWDSRCYVKHCTDILNKVMAFHCVFTKQGCNPVSVFFTYGAEMDPEGKSRWRRWVREYIATHPNMMNAVFTIAGGDDTASIILMSGKYYQVEKDLSMCDQSHDRECLTIFFNALVCLPLMSRPDAEAFTQLIAADFGLKFDYTEKRRPFLPTGIGPTSLFNTLVVGMEEVFGLVAAIQKLQMTMRTMVVDSVPRALGNLLMDIHKTYGRKIKIQVTTNQHHLSFHKGVWIGSDFMWTPLPSRCWKFGVAPIDTPDSNMPDFMADVAWSWSTSRLDPVFYAFISPYLARARIMHALEDNFSFAESVVAEAPAWFEFGAKKMVKADREPLPFSYCASFYQDRYGLEHSTIQQVIDEVSALEPGHVFPDDHPLVRILEVDILEKRLPGGRLLQ